MEIVEPHTGLIIWTIFTFITMVIAMPMALFFFKF